MNVVKQIKAKPGAIYHFTCKVHSRASGPCSVNLAAYRAGARLRSELTGRICNHTRKKEVLWSKILAPIYAPAWAGDRGTLWNAVDAIEKRKDAQLTREVEVALPLALAPSANCALLLEWAETTFVSQGMVADVCYHNKPGNPHAHILLTLRDIDADGFGKKNRSWNNPNLVESWRASWAEIVNRHLDKAGLNVRIDHRSFKRQGLNLTPTKHVGRQTPWNGEKVAEVSMENKLILIERNLQQQKQELKAKARIADAKKPETHTPSPTFTSPQRPPRVRRPRPARVSPSQGSISRSGPSF